MEGRNKALQEGNLAEQWKVSGFLSYSCYKLPLWPQASSVKKHKSTPQHILFSQWVSLPSATWQHSSWIFFWIWTNRRLSVQSVEAHGLKLNIITPQQKCTGQEKILTSKKVSERSGRETQSCKVAYFSSSARSEVERETKPKSVMPVVTELTLTAAQLIYGLFPLIWIVIHVWFLSRWLVLYDPLKQNFTFCPCL